LGDVKAEGDSLRSPTAGRRPIKLRSRLRVIRFEVRLITRGQTIHNTPANVGAVCHSPLRDYIYGGRIPQLAPVPVPSRLAVFV